MHSIPFPLYTQKELLCIGVYLGEDFLIKVIILQNKIKLNNFILYSKMIHVILNKPKKPGQGLAEDGELVFL